MGHDMRLFVAGAPSSRAPPVTLTTFTALGSWNFPDLGASISELARFELGRYLDARRATIVKESAIEDTSAIEFVSAMMCEVYERSVKVGQL